MFELLADFHFIRPEWLLAILPCLWLLYRFALYQKSSSGWSSAIDAELLQVQLAPGTQTKRRGITALLGTGLLLGVLALAGPAWERLPQAVEQKREALVIVLDLSLSMYAQDLSPSRLVRARQKITDILRERKEGFTAMVAYAGDAHAVAPLTDDTGTIENLVAALNPSMMPALGSNVGLGIESALQLLENASVYDARILLLTDGIDNIGDVTRHSNPRIPISIIGVGTAAGGSIPLDFVNQPGRILRDEEGDSIVAKLDEARLSSIAELCHGFYSDLTLTMSDIETTLPPLALDEDAIVSDRRFDAWADVGPWLVLLLLPLLLLAFRRGSLAVLLVGIGLGGVVPDARAGLWDDLWQRRDQQAHHALKHGAPEAAAVLFEDKDWKAAAQYRAGEFDKSTNHFQEALSDSQKALSDSQKALSDSDRASLVTDQYNLANSLVQIGQLDDALVAYNKVLELDPEHEDAAFNKELVDQAKEQQQGEASDKDNQESQEDSNEDAEKEREQQSESDGSEEQQQDDSQEQSEGDSQEGEETDSSDAQQQQSPEEGEEQEQEQLAQEPTEEQKAAMEQWLRRVPDEPGGLLRRKFKYETDQRRREGDYQPKAKKIW